MYKTSCMVLMETGIKEKRCGYGSRMNKVLFLFRENNEWHMIERVGGKRLCSFEARQKTKNIDIAIKHASIVWGELSERELGSSHIVDGRDRSMLGKVGHG